MVLKKIKEPTLDRWFFREPSDSLKIFRKTQNTELFYSESFYKPRTTDSLILKMSQKPRTEGSLILKISKRPESKAITTAKKLPTPVYTVLDEDNHFVKLNYWVQLSLKLSSGFVVWSLGFQNKLFSISTPYIPPQFQLITNVTKSNGSEPTSAPCSMDVSRQNIPLLTMDSIVITIHIYLPT
jgi:hypothetical protein